MSTNSARPPRLMLLDTASLYFRAFFGVPDSVKAPDGSPVNAVRGLLDFITRLVNDHAPTQLVACWDDDWRPQWRVSLLPSYKAHRVAYPVKGGPDVEETPDPLDAQVPVIRETLAALGIAVIGAADAEADDVIGTLAARASVPVDIVTGDRDLFQLVDDEREIRVLYTARGIGKLAYVDEAYVREKYGVSGRSYVDFAVLRGDPSDGLPGVPGIGKKTAATLIGRFGSVEGLLAALDDPAAALAPGVRTKLAAARDYLALAAPVVRVATDAPVHLDRDDAVPAAAADPDALTELQRAWGLGGSVDRLLAALPVAGPGAS